mmetsp:Transcript_17299/g.40148  ORF Transcript_17299/g.40148 Transcript_17299/m.40148 type:complete len:128 (-) Transcript_17299:2157-2540(-)
MRSFLHDLVGGCELGKSELDLAPSLKFTAVLYFHNATGQGHGHVPKDSRDSAHQGPGILPPWIWPRSSTTLVVFITFAMNIMELSKSTKLLSKSVRKCLVTAALLVLPPRSITSDRRTTREEILTMP